MSNSHTLDEVRRIFQRHKDEIIKLYQAEGAGIGKEDDTHVIVVYLSSKSHRPDDPVSIEDIPLKFEITGPFRTL